MVNRNDRDKFITRSEEFFAKQCKSNAGVSDYTAAGGYHPNGKFSSWEDSPCIVHWGRKWSEYAGISFKQVGYNLRDKQSPLTPKEKAEAFESYYDFICDKNESPWRLGLQLADMKRTYAGNRSSGVVFMNCSELPQLTMTNFFLAARGFSEHPTRLPLWKTLLDAGIEKPIALYLCSFLVFGGRDSYDNVSHTPEHTLTHGWVSNNTDISKLWNPEPEKITKDTNFSKIQMYCNKHFADFNWTFRRRMKQLGFYSAEKNIQSQYGPMISDVLDIPDNQDEFIAKMKEIGNEGFRRAWQ